MGTTNDIIELTLPLKAEYVSVARLTASAIANRIGFDIETIEDIKVSVAEVCNKLIQTGSKLTENYNIIFKVSFDTIYIVFDSEDKSLRCIFNSDESELGLSIIHALMDDVEICSDKFILSISKVLEGKVNNV